MNCFVQTRAAEISAKNDKTIGRKSYDDDETDCYDEFTVGRFQKVAHARTTLGEFSIVRRNKRK